VSAKKDQTVSQAEAEPWDMNNIRSLRPPKSRNQPLMVNALCAKLPAMFVIVPLLRLVPENIGASREVGR
jgi:hypothetical protein